MFMYKPNLCLLKDRIILVTGAGDGIGSIIARSLATYGATIILIGRTISKLEKVYDDIENLGGPKPAIYPIDLSSASVDDYNNLSRLIDSEFGRVDGLLHNAALFLGLTPIINTNIYDWYQILQVNLTAPFLLTRALMNLLKQANDASVLFTSDQVSEFGGAYWGPYAVSKGGLCTLMQILSKELEDNTSIRVNSIDPGPVNIGITKQSMPGNISILTNPEIIIPYYIYLLGPDSKGVTGKIIRAQYTNIGI